MEIAIKAAQFILSLSILVILHEFGHFAFAKLFKTRVEKFYLFFDPWFSLFKYKKGETNPNNNNGTKKTQKLEKKEETFQIIYADPPYHITSIYSELLSYLDNSTLLSKGGILFLESLSPSPLKNLPLQHLVLTDQRRFGTSLLHQYRR